MSWPTQSDYKDSLQNPDTAFRDPDLRSEPGRAQPDGRAAGRSGAFASVYKMTAAQGPRRAEALQLPQRRSRRSATRPFPIIWNWNSGRGSRRALVDFRVPPRGHPRRQGVVPHADDGMGEGRLARRVGARDDGAEEPRCRRDEENGRIVGGARVEQLQDAKIAHGDLQHDNVMVVGDAPVLVDYDGMCVPALDPAGPGQEARATGIRQAGVPASRPRRREARRPSRSLRRVDHSHRAARHRRRPATVRQARSQDRQREPALLAVRHDDAGEVDSLAGPVSLQGCGGQCVVADAACLARQAVRQDSPVHARPVLPAPQAGSGVAARLAAD